MINSTNSIANVARADGDGDKGLEAGLQRLSKKNPQLFASVISQIKEFLGSNQSGRTSRTRGQFGYTVQDPTGPTSTTTIKPPSDPVLHGTLPGTISAPNDPVLAGSLGPTSTTTIQPPSDPVLHGTLPGTISAPNDPVLAGSLGPTSTTTIKPPSDPILRGQLPGTTTISSNGATVAGSGGALSTPSSTTSSNSVSNLTNSQKLQANVIAGFPIFDRNGSVNDKFIKAFADMFGTSGLSQTSSAVAPAGVPAPAAVSSRGVDLQA